MKKKKLFALSLIVSLILCSGCQSIIPIPGKSDSASEEKSVTPSQITFPNPSDFNLGSQDEESKESKEDKEDKGNSTGVATNSTIPTRLAVHKGYIYNNAGQVNEEFAEKGDMLEYLVSGNSSQAVVIQDNACYYVSPSLEAEMLTNLFVINARINYDGGYIYYLANNYQEDCSELYCYETASGKTSRIWQHADITYAVSPDGRTVAFISTDAEGTMMVIESMDRKRELFNVTGRAEIISVSNDGLVYFSEDLRSQALYKYQNGEVSVILDDSTDDYFLDRNCRELLFMTSLTDGFYYYTPDMKKPFLITDEHVYSFNVNVGTTITYTGTHETGAMISGADTLVGIMYDKTGGRVWFAGPDSEDYTFPEGAWNFGVVKQAAKSYAIRYLRSEKKIYLDTMENGKIENELMVDGMSTRGMPTITIDGSVWIASSEGELYLYRNGSLTPKATGIVQGSDSVMRYDAREDLLYVAIDGYLCAVDKNGTVTKLHDNCAEMYASMEYEEFPCFSDASGKRYAYIYGYCMEIQF